MPSLRACDAAIGSKKNIHTGPPLPERDRSKYADPTQAGCFKERESVESPGLPVEVDSEKPTSIIKKQRIDVRTQNPAHVRWAECDHRPFKWHSNTSSFTGMKAWFVHSPHLTCGFPQTPRTHSLLHAHGAYPDRPVHSGSPIGPETHLSGPQRAARNSAILSTTDEPLVTPSS